MVIAATTALYAQEVVVVQGQDDQCKGKQDVFSLGQIRIGGGGVYLLDPTFDNIKNIPGSTVNRWGGSGTLQFMFGSIFDNERVFWGISGDYLRTYNYKTPAVGGTREVTLTSIPIQVIWEWDLGGKKAAIFPFIQWGLGASIDRLETKAPLGGNDTTTTTDFVLSGGPGFGIRLSDAFSVDFIGKYYLLFTGSQYTQVLNFTGALNFKIR